MACNIEKQLHINRLDVSIDILSEIKSYCFYDKKTWDMMQFIKTKKNKINIILNTKAITRANPVYMEQGDDPDKEEHWIYGVFEDDNDLDSLQLQAVSCGLCGNYKSISGRFDLPERIICRCNIEEEDNSDNDSWFSYDSDDTDDLSW